MDKPTGPAPTINTSVSLIVQNPPYETRVIYIPFLGEATSAGSKEQP